MKRIYISGPITNNANYKASFNAVENKLIEMGLPCYNPAEQEVKSNKCWADYMKTDINELLKCDAIYMMKGWRLSRGAKLERHIAKKLGYFIIYERG